MDEKYRFLYLKYKQKYINLKGGRLIDILNSPENTFIKTKCDTINNIKTNFNFCNKVNDCLATSKNSYIIFIWFLNSITEAEIETLEKIILFHKAKSTNVFIFSNYYFTTTNKSINSTVVTYNDFSTKFKQKIIDIIELYKTRTEFE
jgi:hypothetical protein